MAEKWILHQANALFWIRAVDLQHGRVNDVTASAHDRLQDAVFFAFALGGLHEAARATAELLPIGEAFAAFDAGVPHAKDVRDILSHVGDHMELKGGRQRNEFFEFEVRAAQAEGPYSIEIGGRYKLEVEPAWWHAHALWAAILAARPARNDEPPPQDEQEAAKGAPG